ncbi:MAG: DNA-binding protein [Candidatus Latescibacterota bacterium]|nr:MAG: DNA-binding protein [Candidatus Latescibacterota bacterium]
MSAVQNWLRFADEDLKMAKLAMKEGLYNQVCFHCQQAVEKALKGFLSHLGQVSPKTHKLIDILSLLPERTPFEDLEESIGLLDRFYIPTRYPDVLPGALPNGLPDREDAEEALSLAEEVLARVRGIVR